MKYNFTSEGKVIEADSYEEALKILEEQNKPKTKSKKEDK